MPLRQLLSDRSAVEWFVSELWLPYHRELGSTVDAHALADGVEASLDSEIAYWIDRLDDSTFTVWVAVDETPDGAHPFDTTDPLGFVATEFEPAPAVFDRPDRLVIGDLYVRSADRGTGLADRLVDRAIEDARKLGCESVALDVAVDNDRALSFYRKRGFSPVRHRLVTDIDPA